MKTKVAFNSCYGGFSLSKQAIQRLEAEGVEEPDCYWDLCRHDPRLIRVIEELGAAACGEYTTLAVVEVEGDRYFIDEDDGWETVITPKSLERRWVVI